MDLQIKSIQSDVDKLHYNYGSPELQSVYGAGEIYSPELCLIFMNPTSKNISTSKNWRGFRAPWLGTKNIWNLLYKLEILDDEKLLSKINSYEPFEWSYDFCLEVYTHVRNKSVYITNLAKCTQLDARPISNKIYKEFLPLMKNELLILKPKKVITFGNQVSSILVGKNVSVSNYIKDEYEIIKLNNGKITHVFPCYYPVGQGTPNIGKAMARIKMIL